jgi:hypothetical protein
VRYIPVEPVKVIGRRHHPVGDQHDEVGILDRSERIGCRQQPRDRPRERGVAQYDGDPRWGLGLASQHRRQDVKKSLGSLGGDLQRLGQHREPRLRHPRSECGDQPIFPF